MGCPTPHIRFARMVETFGITVLPPAFLGRQPGRSSNGLDDGFGNLCYQGVTDPAALLDVVAVSD